MVLKNGVKNIQAAGYNGARTVVGSNSISTEYTRRGFNLGKQN